MKPTFFVTPERFRKWLEQNHHKHTELWVGYYKKATGRPSITWPESVDQALCFGWIDGIRKSLDEESYVIRFTPRRKKSIWSAVNIKRATELKRLGLMHPAGLAAFDNRSVENSLRYSFEQSDVQLAPKYQQKIRANRRAWEFFKDLAPSAKKPSVWWVMSAKREETRLRRLDQLIACCQRGEKIPPLTLQSKPRKKK